MPYLLLVYAHLLATCMALGAIVATDLRMLSRLAHDRVRIAPPNGFVARLVTIALVVLWLTGAALVARGLEHDPAFVSGKLLGKLVLVVLLTVNAWVLHRVTFPRLARGRSVGRWRLADYAVVAPPVALSNALWMFTAFLGIARPWNGTVSAPAVLAIAVALYAVALLAVVALLAAAGWRHPHGRFGALVMAMRRALARIGSLGRDDDAVAPVTTPTRARSSLPPSLANAAGALPRIAPGAASAMPPSVVVLDAHRRARAARRQA